MSALLPATEHALLHRVALEQTQHRAPSVAAAVIRDGHPVWYAGRGRVGDTAPTADTQYRIGSITKTFVAVLVMRLRDEGLLDLADPLDTHLPGTPLGALTIGQLLAHTGGVRAEPAGSWWERSPGNDWPTLAAAMDDTTLRHRPGRRFHYSNLGYAALGELVTRIRHTPWSDAVATEILQPLEMTRTTTRPTAPHATGWAVHPYADVLLPEPEHDARAMSPAGQLWSTPTDLARWAAFLAGQPTPVLRPDSLAEMREPAALDDIDTWQSGYGLGVQLRRDRNHRLAGHTGSMPGFLAAVWAHPETGTAAVAMSNATSGPQMGTLAADLVELLNRHEPRLPAEWTPLREVDDTLLALTGSWYWGARPYTLRLLPDRWLTLTPAGHNTTGIRFRPQPDGTWQGLDHYFTGETLQVVHHPDGTVSHLDLATFIFTRTPYDPTAPIPGGLDEGTWQPDPNQPGKP